MASFERMMKEKVRRATKSAMEALAYNTVRELQEAGPFWDGNFANSWDVLPGSVNVAATKPGKLPFSETAQPRSYVEPQIPETDLRRGYTIGNRMEYRAIAMDLVPGRIKKGGNETAEQDWYDTLMGGGELIRVNKVKAEQAFRKELKKVGRSVRIFGEGGT